MFGSYLTVAVVFLLVAGYVVFINYMLTSVERRDRAALAQADAAHGAEIHPMIKSPVALDKAA